MCLYYDIAIGNLRCRNLLSKKYVQVAIVDLFFSITLIMSVLVSLLQSIQWFRIDGLPRHRKDLTSKQALGKSANSFFMIIPFIRLVCPIKRRPTDEDFSGFFLL